MKFEKEKKIENEELLSLFKGWLNHFGRDLQENFTRGGLPVPIRRRRPRRSAANMIPSCGVALQQRLAATAFTSAASKRGNTSGLRSVLNRAAPAAPALRRFDGLKCTAAAFPRRRGLIGAGPEALRRPHFTPGVPSGAGPIPLHQRSTTCMAGSHSMLPDGQLGLYDPSADKDACGVRSGARHWGPWGCFSRGRQFGLLLGQNILMVPRF